MMCGGLGSVEEADENVRDLCHKIKPDLETKADRKFQVYEPLSYCSQVVAGTNYFVKIHVGNEECVHVRIFRPLPHTKEEPQFSAHQPGKTKDDPIEYFASG